MAITTGWFNWESRVGATYATMSQRVFNLTLSGFIAGGLALAAWTAGQTYNMHPTFWWFIGYFLVAIPGVLIALSTQEWPVAAFGYGLVILATGTIVGPYVHLYKPAVVIQVALITFGVTVVIGFAGAVWPKSVEHWGGFLLTGLLVLIGMDVVQGFMPYFGFEGVSMKWKDWLAVFLFSGYIFYDMNRAQRVDYTVNNAVQCSLALYLDVINLFIRLLSTKWDD